MSVGAALAADADVTIVEREPSLAFHTTGRSAALLFDNYGAAPVRPLTRASRPFFESPPDGVTDHPLLEPPRGALTIADTAQLETLDAFHAAGLASGTVSERIDTEEAVSMCPILRPEAVGGAVWEPEAADLDVAGLHQAFVRVIRARGGAIRTTSGVTAATRTASRWDTAIGDGTHWQGDLIVNAAGAWGDELAAVCGVAPIGLNPCRRTAFMIAAPERSDRWPFVVDVDHDFYFKPDGVQMLCSLGEETPMEPADARADEMDVALAIDRINAATTLDIRHVRSAWAGQRTFTPDRVMAIGPDPDTPAFVWLVGQGGTGIQTAPAAGRLAAALALGSELPDDLAAAGVDPVALAPDRFRD